MGGPDDFDQQAIPGRVEAVAGSTPAFRRSAVLKEGALVHFVKQFDSIPGRRDRLDDEARRRSQVYSLAVTNDPFAPLCARSARRATGLSRRRRGGTDAATAGRWSSVSNLVAGEGSDTHRAHARALMLLKRHGIASRDVLGTEDLQGGYSAFFPVYREMEEVGKLRRGHFAEALTGAPFAVAGVVDRLRGLRESRGDREVALLATVDPANPYGSTLDGPESRGEANPRRVVGASVVLVDGALVLYLDKAAQRVMTFDGASDEENALFRAKAIGALAGLFQQRSRKSLPIEQVDGVAAARSEVLDLFLAAGFRTDSKGLVLERFSASG